MEQRVYDGKLAPEGLADYLVQRFNEGWDFAAQKIGQDESFIVQIGYARHHHARRPAVTVGITRPPGQETGLQVTLGEQQWIGSEFAQHALVTGLIAAMITPWALFGLIGPASRMLGAGKLPDDVWETVETYVHALGGAPVRIAEVIPPAPPVPEPVGADAPAAAPAPYPPPVLDPEKTRHLS